MVVWKDIEMVVLKVELRDIFWVVDYVDYWVFLKVVLSVVWKESSSVALSDFYLVDDWVL